MRSHPLLLVIAAGVLLGAAGVVIGLLGSESVEGSAIPAPPATSSPERPCSMEVTVFLDTDEEMRQVVEKLRGDRRVDALTTETKQQAYERFKVIFKDQPELVELARPEALPASVRVTPAGRMPTTELLRQLRAEFPGENKVNSVLPC